MSGSLDGFYVNRHRSQYAIGQSRRTRTSGCTWTSLANGADASTGGKVDRTPDQVLTLVLPSEETNPLTPGWSLPDAVLAAKRLGTPLDDRTGEGWAGVETALVDSLYVLLQGDSDQFGNATCSGDFDGDHCIGVHPAKRLFNGQTQHWIDDPICQTGRWEYDLILRKYAEKLLPAVRFAAFLQPVPRSRYRVAITGYTPLYTKPGGVRSGAVRLATYICLRSLVDGLWWYRILSKADGSPTKNAGKSFKPNRNTEAHPI